MSNASLRISHRQLSISIPAVLTEDKHVGMMMLAVKMILDNTENLTTSLTTKDACPVSAATPLGSPRLRASSKLFRSFRGSVGPSPRSPRSPGSPASRRDAFIVPGAGASNGRVGGGDASEDKASGGWSPGEARKIDRLEGAGTEIGGELARRMLDEMQGLRRSMAALEVRLGGGAAGKRMEEERDDDKGRRAGQKYAAPGGVGLFSEEQLFLDEEQFAVVRGDGRREKFEERRV